MEQKTDNELIRIYREGNVMGFNELLERYQAKVYGYIFSVVKNKEKADEVFQETFYKVIDAFINDQYTYEGRFVPWVVGIAHNIIVEQGNNKKC